MLLVILMSVVLENLRFKRIIAHEAPIASALAAGAQPQYSSAMLTLDPNALGLITKRIQDSLGRDSHSVELAVDDPSEGSVFDLCTSILDVDDERFVKISRSLAIRLMNAQTAPGIRAGLAVIIEGTVGPNNNRFVAVIKAETDTGLIKDVSEGAVVLNYIADLVLGAQQKLYKIGFFFEKTAPGHSDELRAAIDFDVIVFDYHMTQSGARDAALYFYQGFLGCSIAENAKRVTMDFYEHTSKYIDNLKIPPEDKVDLKNNLTAYLRSNQPLLSVKTFSDDFLSSNFQRGYKKFMGEAGFESRDYPKDTSLIHSKLRVRRIMFSSKVKIIGPSDHFGQLVQVIGKDGSWTNVKIAGEITEQ